MALAVPPVVEPRTFMSATHWTTPAEEDPPWDAIVIGAGPAGAVAARELARGGARVLLVEKLDFPREKVCGGCLNGQALGVLASVGLGALPQRSGGVPLGSFRLGVRGRAYQLDLPDGMAVPRGRFDAELVSAAVEAGVCFQPRTEARVGACGGTTVRVRLGRERGDRTVEARVVLVATGLGHTCLPTGARPRLRIARGSRMGTGCFLEDGPCDYNVGTIHMAVGRAGYVGLVRLADGRLHVAGAIHPRILHAVGGPGAAAECILAEAGFAAIAGLRNAQWRGTSGLTRRTRPLADARLFILGDAAGYIEPFTGEGIAWALAAGRAIGPLALRAIERWEPRFAADWDRLHGRVVRRRQIICRAAAAVLWRPLLVHAAIAMLTRMPGSTMRLLRSLNAPPPFMEAS
jgi:2-polyprenyl-6-methoxyphenol hydroxylase-like FAD-dependent oxidoreductase